MVKLFKKNTKGLLVEVDPAQADAARANGKFSRVAGASYDVLWTAAEIAARNREEKAAAEDQRVRELAVQQKAAIRTSALEKMKALGLTDEEIESLR